MDNKWLKLGGITLSIVGAAVGLASDLIGKKQAAETLANSKEVKDLIQKEVQKALSGK